jgi:pSer/pThr/pTyr-binding forkhead associated (FHA) protein
VRVVDLKSTNGTLVNGRRVRESALHDGDRLDIGATGLIYRDSADEGPR